MEVTLEQLLQLLQLRGAEGGGPPSQPREKVLDPLSEEGVVSCIKKIGSTDDKRKVIVMTGAGISTAAGIPDFRSPGTGLYDNLQQFNLPNPQAIFEINFFRCNPKPFFTLAKELYPKKFKPTKSHYFIRMLAEKGLLMRNYTQNIDMLERRAGIEGELLVEAHGTFHTAHCLDCGQEYPLEYVQDKVLGDEVPTCTKPDCAKNKKPRELSGEQPYSGLVKPDIVFFGEALPDRFALCAAQDFKKCELLIVMGTSLLVQPFASLVDRVPDECPRLLINREKVGEDPIMKLLTGGRGGMDFSEETGYRDVFLPGDCDSGCEKLADLLGWRAELEKLYHVEHDRLEEEIKREGLGGGGEPAEIEAGGRQEGGGGEDSDSKATIEASTDAGKGEAKDVGEISSPEQTKESPSEGEVKTKVESSAAGNETTKAGTETGGESGETQLTGQSADLEEAGRSRDEETVPSGESEEGKSNEQSEPAGDMKSNI